MTDRDALLAAIAAAPPDDAPRLVFADWLDEHGDPARADFIRVQVELAPFERAPDTDEAAWQRAVVRARPDAPLPPGFPEGMRRYADLVRREVALSKAHQYRWIGPLNPVDEDPDAHLRVVFRRGFPEAVGLTTSAFLESGPAVRQACPTLQRLTLYGPRDRGPDLAACPALRGVPELDLAGWVTPFDARFLATYLAVNPVRSLTLWIGSRHDDEVIRTLATRPWLDESHGPSPENAVLAAGPYLGRLEELVLVQLHGGTMAEDPAGLDRRADGLAVLFNDTLGRSVARVERPFARRFPLDGVINYRLFAGHMAGGPVLIRAGGVTVVLPFDADGRLTNVFTLDMREHLLIGPIWHSLGPDYGRLRDVLQRAHGYQPGLIFVREFTTPFVAVGWHGWGTYEDVIADPDAFPDRDDQEEACAALDAGWVKGGNFVVQAGDDNSWAGPDGSIHTS